MYIDWTRRGNLERQNECGVYRSCAPAVVALRVVLVDRREPKRSFPPNSPLPSRECVLPLRERKDQAGEDGRGGAGG